MRYLVTRVIELSKVVYADNKEEAIEFFTERDADTRLLREKAVKQREPYKPRVLAANWKENILQ